VSEELLQEITQKYFYLQMRESILGEDVYCPPETAVLLASYSLQAKYGDWSEENQEKSKNERLLPNVVINQHQISVDEWHGRICEWWKEHKDLDRDEAMMEYLKIAQDLEMYGVNYFDIKNKKGTELLLGVDALGLNIYSKDDRLTPKIGFPWSEIRNISYSDKKFVIKSIDKNSGDFIFYSKNLSINKKILALCVGNHEMYMKRRKPETIERQQMKAECREKKMKRQEEKRKLRAAQEEHERAVKEKMLLEEKVEQAAEEKRRKEEEKAEEERRIEEEKRLERERIALEMQQKEHEIQLLKEQTEKEKEQMEKEIAEMQEQAQALEMSRRTLEEQREQDALEKEQQAEMLKKLEEEKKKKEEELERLEEERRMQEELERQRKVEEEERLRREEEERREREEERKREEEERQRREEEERAAFEEEQQRLAEEQQRQAEEAKEDEQDNEEQELEDTQHIDSSKDVERDMELDKNERLKSQLEALKKDLQGTTKKTSLDILHDGNVEQGRDKYKTLKQIRSGNTKTRVEQFENL